MGTSRERRRVVLTTGTTPGTTDERIHTMKRSLHLPAVTFAGLVTTGLLALPVSSAFADDDVAMKRDDDGTELVAVSDDDGDGDDNTNTRGGDGTNSGTGNSNDGTGSGSTAVSRDRDASRGDKTKDRTRDGGDRTRDNSANKTNDRSRNDTRG